MNEPTSTLAEIRIDNNADLLRFFAYQHIASHLQKVSRPIGELAEAMAAMLPPGPEVTAGLRKLLEAKDCFVRAALPR